MPRRNRRAQIQRRKAVLLSRELLARSETLQTPPLPRIGAGLSGDVSAVQAHGATEERRAKRGPAPLTGETATRHSHTHLCGGGEDTDPLYCIGCARIMLPSLIEAVEPYGWTVIEPVYDGQVVDTCWLLSMVLGYDTDLRPAPRADSERVRRRRPRRGRVRVPGATLTR